MLATTGGLRGQAVHLLLRRGAGVATAVSLKDRASSDAAVPTPSQPSPTRRRHRHWLDRWPAASAWLAGKARRLWMAGLAERCRSHPALLGREGLVRAAVTARAADLEAGVLAALAEAKRAVHARPPRLARARARPGGVPGSRDRGCAATAAARR